MEIKKEVRFEGPVEPGQGSYAWNDLNDDGIQQKNEFFLAERIVGEVRHVRHFEGEAIVGDDGIKIVEEFRLVECLLLLLLAATSNLYTTFWIGSPWSAQDIVIEESAVRDGSRP